MIGPLGRVELDFLSSPQGVALGLENDCPLGATKRIEYCGLLNQEVIYRSVLTIYHAC